MHLTERQVQILNLLHSGMNLSQAAQTLGIRFSTATSYLNRAAQQNGYDNRKDIIKITKYAALKPTNKYKKRNIARTEAGTYRAQIKATIAPGKQKLISLGTFRTETKALAAKIAAEEKYYIKRKAGV